MTITTYRVLMTPLGRDSNLGHQQEVICDIQIDPENGQGVIMDKNGSLIFTKDNNDVVIFAPGIWAAVTSA